MSGSSGKQYGLLLPKKDKGDTIQRPAIFDEDSDSGGSATGTGDWVKKTYQKEANKSTEKRQTKIHMQKALTQDPTIYQYDEVYDDIKDKNSKSETKKDEKKSSRYIQSLKKNAERRKLENERRQERIVQKERLAEGEQFKDKESFVTSAYRKKLEEFNKMDEEEKKMDYLEDICDVSKQKDLSGFYRHLYKSTVDDKDETKTEPLPVLAETTSKADNSNKQPHKSKRQYRKHNRSESSLEEGEANDSDSCSSSSSTSCSNSESGEELQNNKDKKQTDESISKVKKEESSNFDKHKRLKRGDENEKKPVDKSKHEETEKEQAIIKPVVSNDSNEELTEAKPKINIWAKRTIGTVFDDALKNFLERTANRQGVF